MAVLQSGARKSYRLPARQAAPQREAAPRTCATPSGCAPPALLDLQRACRPANGGIGTSASRAGRASAARRKGEGHPPRQIPQEPLQLRAWLPRPPSAVSILVVALHPIREIEVRPGLVPALGREIKHHVRAQSPLIATGIG